MDKRHGFTKKQQSFPNPILKCHISIFPLIFPRLPVCGQKLSEKESCLCPFLLHGKSKPKQHWLLSPLKERNNGSQFEAAAFHAKVWRPLFLSSSFISTSRKWTLQHMSEAASVTSLWVSLPSVAMRWLNSAWHVSRNGCLTQGLPAHLKHLPQINPPLTRQPFQKDIRCTCRA